MRFQTPTRLAAAAVALIPAAAWATPQPWQIGQQAPATPIMERVHSFHDLLVWIIAAIVIFVFALLAYACWRFAEKRNPVPSRRSHHTAARGGLDRGAGADPGDHRHPVVQAALLHGRRARDRADDQGHRAPVVLELHLPGQRQLHLRRLHDRRQRSAAGPAAPAGDRQPAGGTGRRPTSASRPPRPTCCTAGPCRSSGSRSTRSRAA